MYLCALKVGFTATDLRTMPFPLLTIFLDEWSNMQSFGEAGEGAKKATQADIDSMLA